MVLYLSIILTLFISTLVFYAYYFFNKLEPNRAPIDKLFFRNFWYKLCSFLIWNERFLNLLEQTRFVLFNRNDFIVKGWKSYCHTILSVKIGRYPLKHHKRTVCWCIVVKKHIVGVWLTLKMYSSLALVNPIYSFCTKWTNTIVPQSLLLSNYYFFQHEYIYLHAYTCRENCVTTNLSLK